MNCKPVTQYIFQRLCLVDLVATSAIVKSMLKEIYNVEERRLNVIPFKFDIKSNNVNQRCIFDVEFYNIA